MKAFFDTSVLVAAFVPSHPRHKRAFDRVRRTFSGKIQGYALIILGGVAVVLVYLLIRGGGK